MREIKFRIWMGEKKAMAPWEMILGECNRLSVLSLPEFTPMQSAGCNYK